MLRCLIQRRGPDSPSLVSSRFGVHRPTSEKSSRMTSKDGPKWSSSRGPNQTKPAATRPDINPFSESRIGGTSAFPPVGSKCGAEPARHGCRRWVRFRRPCMSAMAAAFPQSSRSGPSGHTAPCSELERRLGALPEPAGKFHGKCGVTPTVSNAKRAAGEPEGCVGPERPAPTGRRRDKGTPRSFLRVPRRQRP
jgi:hypothetical protein